MGRCDDEVTCEKSEARRDMCGRFLVYKKCPALVKIINRRKRAVLQN
jgi:hypothetical protein